MATDQTTVTVNPPTSGEIQALKHLTPEEIKTAEQLAHAVDIRNSIAITGFGVKPQTEMSALADPILRMVKTKDAGDAGEVLTELLNEIEGFDGGLLDDLKSGLRSFPVFGGMFNKVEHFKSRHEKVGVKVERTKVALERSKSRADPRHRRARPDV